MVSTGVRLFALLAATSLWLAACAQPPASAPAIATSASTSINPARIERVRAALPAGYEVAALPAAAAPAAFWGLGPQWTAEPPQCGALADPTFGGATAKGWSASGPGGIVYAVVSASAASLDQALVDECGQWTASSGHTAGTVGFVAPPTIEGAATVGMATSTTTVVEGGTETHSHADTFTAYLGDYIAHVTVVGDPGSPNPQLGLEFASQLLVKTVSALRG
ncbi:DUF5642 family protein [Mycobacterium sp. NPDC048908]|uniref:DUF5642 family protein n=1 Tax=Mycobacterium sp. NPDC048908 TaxID=3364292 RepID=UPI003710D06A